MEERFIHPPSTDSSSIPFMANIPLYSRTTFSLSIHLLMDIWVAFISQLLCSISLPPGVHASLRSQAEQDTIILLPPKIQIIMNSSVNPLLLRPVLGTALGIDSVLAQDEALYGMSAVRSSCSWPFPSGGSYSICKTQKCRTSLVVQ